ncbi:MAG: hypothetical protein MK299_12330 [Pseudomonadales bacterium]|nr:hypothetical protein [Pseudomonadales bacterium]
MTIRWGTEGILLHTGPYGERMVKTNGLQTTYQAIPCAVIPLVIFRTMSIEHWGQWG